MTDESSLLHRFAVSMANLTGTVRFTVQGDLLARAQLKRDRLGTHFPCHNRCW